MMQNKSLTVIVLMLLSLWTVLLAGCLLGEDIEALREKAKPPAPVTYRVRFNINGGSGTTPAAQTVIAGSTIRLPNGSSLSRTSHTFGGWNTNAAGTGTNYNASTMYIVTDDITFYARWNPLPVFNPPPVLSLIAGNAGITYSWVPSTPTAQRYDVYWAQGTRTAGQLFATPLPAGVTRVANATSGNAIAGLTNGQVYSVMVVAHSDEYGYEPGASNVATATPVPSAFTTAPNLSVTAGNAGVSYTLTDSAPAASSYTLYYAQGTQAEAFLVANGAAVTAQTVAPGTNTISGLTNGQQYSFVVIANLSGYQGNNSSGVITRTPQATPNLNPGVTLSVTAGNASVSYTVGATNPAAGSYTLYYAQGNISETVLIAGGSSQTVMPGTNTISGLTNGQLYSFVVVARLGGYNDSISSVQQATPVGLFTTMPGLTVTTGNASVSYTLTASNPAATTYYLYYAQGNQSAAQLIASGNRLTVTPGTNTISGLTNNQQYSFVVVAIAAGRIDGESAVRQATPVGAFITAPNLTAATAGNGSITCTWAASVPAAASYTVYWIAGSGNAAQIKASGASFNAGTALTYTITGLTNGIVYSVVVTATAAGYTASDSNVRSISPVQSNFTTAPGLTVTAGNGSVSYTRTASDPAATGYTLYYMTGNQTAATLIASGTQVNVTTTGGTISGLTNGQLYSFVVVANLMGYAGNNTSAVRTATPVQSITYTITVLPSVGGTGTINVPATSPAEALVNVNITPPPNRRVVAVRVMRGTQQLRVYDVDNSPHIPNFIMPAANVTVEVTYGPQQVFPVIIDGGVMSDIQLQGSLVEGAMFGNIINPTVTLSQGGMSGNPCLVINHTGEWGALIIGGSVGVYPYTTHLSGATALSFWIRGDVPASLSSVYFGSDNYLVSYNGESGTGIPFTTQWQNVLIPVPNGAAELGTLFAINSGTTSAYVGIYIDRVEYVVADLAVTSITTNAMLPIPGPPNTTNLRDALNMDVGYTVGGQTRTLRSIRLAWYPTATYTVTGNATNVGSVITPTAAPGIFNLQVGFGGRISPSTPYHITLPFKVLEDFTPNTVPERYHYWDWGQTEAAWIAEFRTAYTGPTSPAPTPISSGPWTFWAGERQNVPRPNTFFILPNHNESWYVNNGWAGMTGHNWNLTDYNAVQFEMRINRGTSTAANGTASFRLELQNGTTWHPGPTLRTTNYGTWEMITIPFSSYPGLNSSAVTGWRLWPTDYTIGDTNHVSYYMNEIRAITVPPTTLSIDDFQTALPTGPGGWTGFYNNYWSFLINNWVETLEFGRYAGMVRNPYASAWRLYTPAKDISMYNYISFRVNYIERVGYGGYPGNITFAVRNGQNDNWYSELFTIPSDDTIIHTIRLPIANFTLTGFNPTDLTGVRFTLDANGGCILVSHICAEE